MRDLPGALARPLAAPLLDAQVLSTLFAGAALTTAKGALAAGATPVDLFDDRKAIDKVGGRLHPLLILTPRGGMQAASRWSDTEETRAPCSWRACTVVNPALLSPPPPTPPPGRVLTSSTRPAT